MKRIKKIEKSSRVHLRRVHLRLARVPVRITAVFILYGIIAGLLFLSMILGILGYNHPLYHLSPLLSYVGQMIGIVLVFLGASYVGILAELIGLLQSIVIASIVIFIFVGLYLSSGMALRKKKLWARKTAIILSLTSLVISSLLLSLGIYRLHWYGWSAEGKLFLLSVASLIVPVLVGWYLMTNEAKTFFSINSKKK